MKVLKFGGSSVANAENIQKVVSIVKQPQYTNAIVVVSALGGVTDSLISLATKASNGDESYKESFPILIKAHNHQIPSGELEHLIEKGSKYAAIESQFDMK